MLFCWSMISPGMCGCKAGRKLSTIWIYGRPRRFRILLKMRCTCLSGRISTVRTSNWGFMQSVGEGGGGEGVDERGGAVYFLLDFG